MLCGGRRRAAAAAPAVSPGFLAVLRVHLKLHALAESTLGGYIRTMRNDIKASCQKRLNRIEGQVRGLAKMVDEDRYCIDIVTQISAVRSALRRVEEEILKDHVAHCVEHAINSGDKADQRRKIAELMDVVGRVDR
jgi:DNA-binding FrmR family transcriptional regulator